MNINQIILEDSDSRLGYYLNISGRCSFKETKQLFNFCRIQSRFKPYLPISPKPKQDLYNKTVWRLHSTSFLLKIITPYSSSEDYSNNDYSHLINAENTRQLKDNNLKRFFCLEIDGKRAKKSLKKFNEIFL